MLKRNPYNKSWRWLLATALAIWLSGMSCLLCCGEMASAKALEGGVEACVEAEICPAAETNTDIAQARGEDDCCSESHDQSDSSSCQEECCILDGPSSDLPRTPQPHQLVATAPSAAWNLIPTDTIAPPSFSTGQPRLQNRSGTYLRCCVFLI